MSELLHDAIATCKELAEEDIYLEPRDLLDFWATCPWDELRGGSMTISEIARAAHDDLIATQRTPGLWQQTRSNVLLYWREGLARKLSEVTGDPLIVSYRAIGDTYAEVVAWAASVAGDDRRVA